MTALDGIPWDPTKDSTFTRELAVCDFDARPPEHFPGEYWDAPRVVTVDPDAANLIGSKLDGYTDGYHAPVIDIDVEVHLVPSSTPGHSHFYIEQPVTWALYVKLLEAMVECGIVEGGYLEAALRRGQTHVRKPGVLKTETPF